MGNDADADEIFRGEWWECSGINSDSRTTMWTH